MGLGKKIAYYRKSKNITQDALAKQLGISNQAVSKWETDQSCPDVELLPRLADIFEITLDELFEREFVAKEEAEKPSDAREAGTFVSGRIEERGLPGSRPEVLNASVLYTDSSGLPWENDETLHVAIYIGHKLIRGEELKKRFGKIFKDVTFHYNGPALNVESSFSVVCGEVQGNVTAGSYVECETVGQWVTAGSYVECEDVGNQVTAGSYVECGDVGGNVSAGNNIECEDVEGNVSAEGNVECGDVHGSVTAGGVVDYDN